MTDRLAGRVVLISGGARGMGAAEARLFAREGARVLIGDVLEEEGRKLASEIGEAAHFTRLDVTDEASWQAAVDLARERFGKLDGLVNNAGILRFGLLETTALEEYKSVIDVNQVGVFLGLKTAVGAMREAGGGSIVNISSVAGLQGVAGAVGYTASKHAVRGMTKVAALEFGRYGVRVNSVHPGGVDTPMIRPPGVESVAEQTEGENPYGTAIPRIGQPEEVAELVLWLLSDASSYSTGGEFLIDGGLMAGQTVDFEGMGMVEGGE